MGIAASQARFLAITSRKASCEFQSMNIAQEKLSITRAQTQATQKYQNALNQTKLVWDMNGTTGTTSADGQTYDLTYDIMMTPSALNGYDPYFITNRQGAIVLNSRMATAAKNAGISQKGDTEPSLQGYQKFLEQLGVQGYIASSQVSSMTSDSMFYNPTGGIGGVPIDKTQASAMTLGTWISSLEDKMEADSSFASSITVDLNSLSIAVPDLYVDSSKVEDGKFTIADVLSGNVNIVTSEKSSTLEAQVQAIVDAMITTLKPLFASDTANSEAFNYATNEVKKMLQEEVFGGYNNSVNDVNQAANNYNCIVVSLNSLIPTKQLCGLSLSNIMSCFLTYYAQSVSGFTVPYAVRTKAEDSVFVTQDPDYYYVLNNENAVTEKDLLVADFYSSMYNNLCKSGWTISSGDIDDKDYLAHALKNGQLFVSSMHDDYTYYQDPYTLNGHVIEVTDEEGIAQAELEYEKEKSTLNYKEEQLELDMKNIDTELSALTTEYDTVKNLISKNIEKVFTMFNS